MALPASENRLRAWTSPLATVALVLLLGVPACSREVAGPAAAQDPAAPAVERRGGIGKRDADLNRPAARAAGDHGRHAVEADAERPDRRTAADRLVERTRRQSRRWADVSDAEAAGYRSIGDAPTGYEHFVHWSRAADDRMLDPRRPESLVYEVRGERRRLVSAMYLMPPGSRMDDVPDLGDPRVRWHDHDNLCWDPERRTLSGLLLDGRCVPAGEHIPTPPMLHVWVVDHPCGPFAGIEGHGRSCHHTP